MGFVHSTTAESLLSTLRGILNLLVPWLFFIDLGAIGQWDAAAPAGVCPKNPVHLLRVIAKKMHEFAQGFGRLKVVGRWIQCEKMNRRKELECLTPKWFWEWIWQCGIIVSVTGWADAYSRIALEKAFLLTYSILVRLLKCCISSRHSAPDSDFPGVLRHTHAFLFICKRVLTCIFGKELCTVCSLTSLTVALQ